MENQSPYDSPFLKPEAPNASSSQIMGILSIVLAFFFTIAGLVLGIVAIVQARKVEEMVNANPNMFNPYSLSKAKTGKTCGIIGVVLSGLIIVTAIVFVVILISAFSHFGAHRCY